MLKMELMLTQLSTKLELELKLKLKLSLAIEKYVNSYLKIQAKYCPQCENKSGW